MLFLKPGSMESPAVTACSQAQLLQVVALPFASWSELLTGLLSMEACCKPGKSASCTLAVILRTCFELQQAIPAHAYSLQQTLVLGHECWSVDHLR